MEDIIQIAPLSQIQKQTLRARYIPAVKAAKRKQVIFGTIYWTCMAISILGGVAVTTFLASGASKTANDTIVYLFAVLSSVVASMMVLVKSMKIHEFYFSSVADDLDALVWILISSPMPDWPAFVSQFDSLQKRERGRLQEIAAELSARGLPNDTENIAASTESQ